MGAKKYTHNCCLTGGSSSVTDVSLIPFRKGEDPRDLTQKHHRMGCVGNAEKNTKKRLKETKRHTKKKERKRRRKKSKKER